MVRRRARQARAIPISASTESLNAGIAASVTLYEISRLRAAAKVAKAVKLAAAKAAATA